MSITSALSIAAAGLRANSVQADLVASNISNAQTKGYSRKSAELVTRHRTVEVSSISRAVDPLLDRLDRANISQQARAETIASGLATYTSQLGQPDDAISPSAGIAELYNSLITLSGAPTASSAQMGVVASADRLAKNIASLSTTLGELSREVDLNIRYDVADVNDSLTRLSEINARLTRVGGASTREGGDLLDEQAQLLDRIAGYMDVQMVGGPDGTVNLYTAAGTELLSGRRVTMVQFDSTAGKLFAGDVEITPGNGQLRGFQAGSLGGLFELRSKSIPQIQAELDGYAEMLISRFESVDTTLEDGEGGLFVDRDPNAGTALGLASRLAINPAIDPLMGGDTALIVSGLGSGPELLKGDTSLIAAMMGVIDQRPAGATPLGEGLSLNDYAANMVASQQQMRAHAETTWRQAEVSAATISASRQNLQGVNIDDELQVLMVIEQSFAANSKVLTSLQAMLDDLMNAV